MNNQITFGIITDGTHPERVAEMIASIRRQNIPTYQIVIVGGSEIAERNVKWVPFDESIHPSWLSRKKNLITDNADYDVIVYLHDYLVLSDKWYEGIRDVDIDVGITRMKQMDGTRYHDWTLDAAIPPWWFLAGRSRERQLPYDCTSLTSLMYISGAYWIASKEVMEMYPLNEDMWYPSSEDIEWTHRVRKYRRLQMIGGEDCYVKLIKPKHNPFVDTGLDIVHDFENMTMTDFDKLQEESLEYFKMNRIAPCPKCGGKTGYLPLVNKDAGIEAFGVICGICRFNVGFYLTIREAMIAWYERTHNEGH